MVYQHQIDELKLAAMIQGIPHHQAILDHHQAILDHHQVGVVTNGFSTI